MHPLNRKIARCQAVADDPRAQPEIAATAQRHADALRRRRDAEVAIDWSTRPSSEAMMAGLTGKSVLCADGWFVPVK